MKLIIDIPENYYNECKRWRKQGIDQVAEAIIANGTPYEDRPQGEWETPFEVNDKTYHKCTHCHISSELILINKYCPNCGAEMQVKDELNNELNELKEV